MPWLSHREAVMLWTLQDDHNIASCGFWVWMACGLYRVLDFTICVGCFGSFLSFLLVPSRWYNTFSGCVGAYFPILSSANLVYLILSNLFYSIHRPGVFSQSRAGKRGSAGHLERG